MNSLPFHDPALINEIKRHSRTKILEKDEILISPGDEIVFLPVVLKGCIRIIRQGDNGQEVFLYHLYPGQTCAMSLSCCQAGKKSMVKGVIEDKTEVLLIPVKETESLDAYPEWKTFVNKNYSDRFAELIQVIDLIAFSNMDKQLLHYLQERAKALNTKVLEITHQQIADELHTHREAISRLLRVMEQKKIVHLGRNSIELL
ncbi:MAG: Crp/Fnr family transcriptional regulator [Bacteroidia bacterium]